jgi:hypothetical protein
MADVCPLKIFRIKSDWTMSQTLNTQSMIHKVSLSLQIIFYMNEDYANHHVRSSHVQIISISKEHVGLALENHRVSQVELTYPLAAPFRHWTARTSQAQFTRS